MYTNQQWKDIHKKIIEKVENQRNRYTEGFPDYVFESDKYRQCHPISWVSGFWPGMLLLAYKNTGDVETLNSLREFEAKQNQCFTRLDKLHHDVGFMWFLTSAEDYNYTGDDTARQAALNAAMVLASRFNPKGEYIRAWNDDTPDDHHKAGWAIIDCMLNIELLYWASNITEDGRFKNIANAHADSTLKNFIRPDGTTKHIVSYNTDTGEYIENVTGQGYSVDSCWTRGASWAIYGFIKAYGYTGDKRYMEASQKVANRFLELLGEGNVPPCDFMQPAEPWYLDSSAGAITACGLLDNAKHCPEKKEYYINEAKKLLYTLTEKCADLDPETEGVLRHACQLYHRGKKDCTLIYGDYYYMEAIDKLAKLID